VEGVPVDLRDDDGRTVLFYAAKFSLVQLTAWLIGKQRQSPMQRSTDRSTPLMSAASSGKESNTVVVQQLLDARANASAKNNKGQTALHLACEAADDRCATLLLKLGSRPNILDEEGRTALDVARSAGMPFVMIGRLRNLGADVEDGVGVGTQRHGETAEEAKKREMRARKAEASAAQNWSTWRQAHPWRGFNPDRSAGHRDFLENSKQYAKDDYFLPATPRSGDGTFRAFSPRSNDNLPLFIGSLDMPKAGANAKPPNRIARLKSWTSSLRHRSKTPPPPARSQSARELADWSPMDSNTWAPSDAFG
jgi:hypothetical protein